MRGNDAKTSAQKFCLVVKVGKNFPIYSKLIDNREGIKPGLFLFFFLLAKYEAIWRRMENGFRPKCASPAKLYFIIARESVRSLNPSQGASSILFKTALGPQGGAKVF